ncbi:MAG TPA: hypothetical protein VHN80_13860 [Kineosporiaceae bacterium]|nr:hypothetical protein [Kineosporiaceae bacterium]
MTAATEGLEAKPVAVPFGKPGGYLSERAGRLAWPVGGGRPEIGCGSAGDRLPARPEIGCAARPAVSAATRAASG